MRRTARRIFLSALVLIPVALTGCASAGVSVLNIIGLAEKPLVVMHAAERTGSPEGPLEALDPFAPYAKLNQALGKAVKRTVVPDMCFGFQVEPNLALGIGHIAVVTPLQYGRMKDRSKYPAIAVSIDEHGRAERAAFLIVSATSAIQDVNALRGKTVAFGPTRDGRRHHAALAMLKERGINATDLSLELFPVPGSLKTFPKSRDVMMSVMNGSSDAGFIDEEDWDNTPDAAPAADAPGRSGFRVIAKTAAVAERLILRSPTLDDATVSGVRDFLLRAGDEDAEALRPLRIRGFQEPSAELLARCVHLAEMRSPSEMQAASAPADVAEKP